MLVNPNLVITMGPVPHNLEASTVPALQASWDCVVRGMWTSAWTSPATPQAQLPATLWPMRFIASVCLDTQVRLTMGHTDLCGTAEQTLKTQAIPAKGQHSHLVHAQSLRPSQENLPFDRSF